VRTQWGRDGLRPQVQQGHLGGAPRRVARLAVSPELVGHADGALPACRVQVASTCAAVLWALAVSKGPRQQLQQLGAVEALVAAARRSLELECCVDSRQGPDLRQQFQVGRQQRSLGTLAPPGWC
jgi:hypothetical protein